MIFLFLILSALVFGSFTFLTALCADFNTLLACRFAAGLGLGGGAVEADDRMAGVHQVARHRGAQMVYLEVRPSNLAARELYREAGFQQIAIRPGYYPAHGGREDALFLGITLWSCGPIANCMSSSC